MTIRVYILAFLMISPGRGISQTIPEMVDELLKAYSMQRSFNGVALVGSKGALLLQKGYGLQNVKTGTLNTPNTIFQTGSLTKQFTAAIILQLQDEKKLAIQDPLSKYIPGYPEGDKITLEMLLAHTAGIFSYTNDESFMRRAAERPITLDSLIAYIKSRPLDFQPGTSFSYSNSGYVLLGAVIEKVTGRSYFRAVRERILVPLGMDHSGFDFHALKSAGKAIGYRKLSATVNEPATVVDSSLSYAAGGLYSTAADLYKWDRSLYGHRILSDTSLKQAFTPHRSKYGYGWFVDTTFGSIVMMHGGTISGFSCFMAHIPASETCIILLDNTGAPDLPRIGENIDAILNDRPYDFPEPRQEIVPDTAVLSQYVGEYRFSAEFSITITLENGELMAAAPGQGKNEMFAEKDNLFFMKGVDTRIEFVKGATGRLEKMIFRQEGVETTGIKVR
ncbi:MAG: serine hydrolase [Puia sp.]|nr:serine hydrolase [Puia sp.]